MLPLKKTSHSVAIHTNHTKQMRLLLIITALFITLSANNAFGMVPTHSIHIEWNFEHNSLSADKELTAYRLYKSGTRVCQFDSPYDYEGDCEFTSNNGLFYFSLTAVFEDGTETRKSAAFPFYLGSKETPAKVQGLPTVLGLLLLNDKNKR